MLFNYVLSIPFLVQANSSSHKIESSPLQIRSLEKGDKVPDLEFTSLINAKKKSYRLSDFKGKLLILDFWATWCSSCVAALPKLNELQKKFKDQIQIIGVTDQKFEKIEKFYSQRMEMQNYNLVFPTVTDDRVLANYWPHQTISHLVWINEAGEVIAITDSEEVTESNIRDILMGANVKLKPKTDRKIRSDVNLDEAFALEKLSEPLYQNEGVTEGGIRYKSIITKRVDDITSGISQNFTGRILCQNVLLESLFMNAYSYENLPTGEFLFSFPVNKFRWEVGENHFYNLPSDTLSMLEFWKDNNNYFCYELVFPDFYEGAKLVPGRKNDLRFIAMNIMKQDLKKWTGFTSQMETRITKVLVLKLKDSNKLVSPINYEKTEIDPSLKSAIFKNTRMLHFKRTLHQMLQYAPPLIDETNYAGMINFKLECNLSNIECLKIELQKFGLELVEELRKIPLLVVSK